MGHIDASLISKRPGLISDQLDQLEAGGLPSVFWFFKLFFAELQHFCGFYRIWGISPHFFSYRKINTQGIKDQIEYILRVS